MENEQKLLLIKAIKEAKSPKLAINGAKLLYGNDPSWGDVSRACFEETWADATRMNRLIERKSGNVRWPDRFGIDENRIKSEVNRIKTSKEPSTEWGRVLSTYDEHTLNEIQRLVNLP